MIILVTIEAQAIDAVSLSFLKFGEYQARSK